MRKRCILVVLSLAFAADAALPRPKGAEFAKGAVLTVNGYAGQSTLENFPVLVRIAERDEAAGTGIGGFFYRDVKNAAASDVNDIDIGFTDMQGNGLAYEIDTWNPSGESLVWVALPLMSAETQFVFCYGGDESGKVINDASPWTGTAYKSVFHMTFDGTNTTDSIAGYAGTIFNANAYALGVSGSLAGGCYHCEDNRDKTRCITVDSLAAFQSDTDGVATYSGWFRSLGYSGGTQLDGRVTFTGWGNCGVLWNTKNGGQNKSQGIEFALESSDNNGGSFLNRFSLRDNTSSSASPKDFKGDADVDTLYDGEWHHVALSYNAGTLTIYLDGAAQSKMKELPRSVAHPTDRSWTMRIAGREKTQDCVWTGDLDEFRFRSAASSADWVAAEHATVAKRAVLSAGAVTNTLKSGTYSAAVLAGLGAPVEDSSSGGGGSVVIRRDSLVLKLR